MSTTVGASISHPPASWGRIINGGARLGLEGTKVDVLLRDLDVTMYWSGRARQGEYGIVCRGSREVAEMRVVSRAVKGCRHAVRQFPDALSRGGGRCLPPHQEVMELTGLQDLHAWFTGVPTSPPELVAWVDRLREAISVA